MKNLFKKPNVEVKLELKETFNTLAATLFESTILSPHKNASDRFDDNYTFTVHNARKILESRYKIQFSDTIAPIQAMLDANLLHFPSNRTLAQVKSDAHELQITAKGFAFLQKWFFVNGSHLNIPVKQAMLKAFESNYNSMELIDLERTLITNKIRTTTGLAIILWVRMLGNSPQVFDLNNYAGLSPTASLTSEKKSESDYKLNINANLFGGASPNRSLHTSSVNSNSSVSDEKNNTKSSVFSNGTKLISSIESNLKRSLDDLQLTKSKEVSKSDVSPYYHRSMMHPNSLNSMQYWDSRGIRLFQDLTFQRPAQSKFANPETCTINFVLSGRAILQWLCDCTTVESYREAASLARLLLHNRFFRAIEDPVLDTVEFSAFNDVNGHQSRLRNGEFIASAMYRLTPRGIRLSPWEDDLESERSFYDPGDLQQEYENVQGVLEKKYVDPEDAANWKWEVDCPSNIDEKFADLINLSLVQREPALKILFRLELNKSNCAEVLMFIDEVQRLLLLISAAKDAENTITRRELLEDDIHNLLVRLEKTYINSGSPLELNLSQRDRQLIANVSKYQSLDNIVRSLFHTRDLCTELLRDALINFKTSEIATDIPALKNYVVAKYH